MVVGYDTDSTQFVAKKQLMSSDQGPSLPSHASNLMQP